jgi:hypothetical protein
MHISASGLYVGQKVRALDIWSKKLSQWRLSTVKEINISQNSVLIHYDGWPADQDIWLDLAEARRPAFDPFSDWRRLVIDETILRSEQVFDSKYEKKSCDVPGENKIAGVIASPHEHLLTDDQLATNIEPGPNNIKLIAEMESDMGNACAKNCDPAKPEPTTEQMNVGQSFHNNNDIAREIVRQNLFNVLSGVIPDIQAEPRRWIGGVDQGSPRVGDVVEVSEGIHDSECITIYGLHPDPYSYNGLYIKCTTQRGTGFSVYEGRVPIKKAHEARKYIWCVEQSQKLHWCVGLEQNIGTTTRYLTMEVPSHLAGGMVDFNPAILFKSGGQCLKFWDINDFKTQVTLRAETGDWKLCIVQEVRQDEMLVVHNSNSPDTNLRFSLDDAGSGFVQQLERLGFSAPHVQLGLNEIFRANLADSVQKARMMERIDQPAKALISDGKVVQFDLPIMLFLLQMDECIRFFVFFVCFDAWVAVVYQKQPKTNTISSLVFLLL